MHMHFLCIRTCSVHTLKNHAALAAFDAKDGLSDTDGAKLG